MHDPMTVAWEIKSPFGVPSILGKGKFYPPFITVWHVDPEKDGSDDSCDWFGRNRKLNPKEKAIFNALWHLETILDNRPMYPDHPAHTRFQPLKKAIRELKRREGFRIHPRYHFWHYSIQIHPLQTLKRWLFSRCCVCGGRFKWGYSPLSRSWSGTGPRWFRGEKNVLHGECDGSHTTAQQTQESKE